MCWLITNRYIHLNPLLLNNTEQLVDFPALWWAVIAIATAPNLVVGVTLFDLSERERSTDRRRSPTAIRQLTSLSSSVSAGKDDVRNGRPGIIWIVELICPSKAFDAIYKQQ